MPVKIWYFSQMKSTIEENNSKLYMYAKFLVATLLNNSVCEIFWWKRDFFCFYFDDSLFNSASSSVNNLLFTAFL